ncbi:MAG: peroxiredoxin [Pseudomonadota bacterium]
MIEVGQRMPEAALWRVGPNGPGRKPLKEYLTEKRVVLFGVPGAFTPTCDGAHLPSFIQAADAFRSKGVDHILCVAVNDAHVMFRWSEISGAEKAGIEMLADSDGALARGLGLVYNNPTAGMFGRSRRFAMLIDHCTVTEFNLDEVGQYQASTADVLLGQMP